MRRIFFGMTLLSLMAHLQPLPAGTLALGNAWGEEGKASAITGPCNLQFPRDHGAHPGYRTEWWYYTGNLRAGDGRRYGFQLTFFRSRLTPSDPTKSFPSLRPSAWRTQQLFLAHAALTDIRGKRFVHTEQAARGALDMAGVRLEGGSHLVFLKNWSALMGGEKHQLEMRSPEFSFRLGLVPRKAPVSHGDSGYSLKGSTPERASCYYSFSRMEAEGTLTLQGEDISVQGSAWMDHEFSSAALEADLIGWDWFSAQFPDNTELMVYLLRRKDGTFSSASSGTFVDATGTPTHVTREGIQAEVLDHWSSNVSKGRYPSRWRLRILPLQWDLIIAPNVPDQELRTAETTGVTYWEGSVSVSRTGREGQPVSGEGYMELTGYADAFDAPL